jgi:uncharacterized YigZ family protein
MNALMYTIPAQLGHAEFKDRGSKFRGWAKGIENRGEAESFIEEVRRENPGARHCCYAWRLFPDDPIQMAHDDGEPKHSAGTPLLGQILSRKLYGTAVVVVRYFGGVKLGLPGLIHAYKTTAALTLEAAGTKTVESGNHLLITFPYSLTAVVEKIMHAHQLVAVQSHFGDLVMHTVWTPHRIQPLFREQLGQIAEIQVVLSDSLK